MTENIKKIYQDHVDRIRKQFDLYFENKEYDSVLIHSGQLQYSFLDDYALPFRVNPHFAYWLPVTNNPNCFIFYKKNMKPILFYYKVTDYWHSAAENPNGFWTDSFDIRVIQSIDDLKKSIPSFASTCYIGQFSKSIGLGFNQVNHDQLIHELHWDRAIKSDYELYCLSKANDFAAKAHEIAKKMFYNGVSELEIHYEYLKCLGILEKETPYGNIIALNENAATLHYTECKTIKHAENSLFSFLIDAGYSYNGYAADITRTYSYRNDEFAEMISVFDKKQLEIVDQMQVNKSYTEVHRFAHLKVAETLSEFQFVNDLEPEEIVQKGISRTFFPHGIGHLLGLQVHDVGGQYKNNKGELEKPPNDFPSLRSTRIMEEKQVYTIEPGLYFILSLLDDLKQSSNKIYMNWEKISSFMKFGGIRIEDNVYIQNNSIVNLTRDSFKRS